MKMCSAVLALVLLVGTPIAAQTPAPAPPSGGAAGSLIQISRLTQFRTPYGGGNQEIEAMECVSFVNASARDVTHVRFVFAYDDAAGKTLGGGVLDRRGSFSTGALIAGAESFRDARRDGGKLRNCRPFNGEIDKEGNLEFRHSVVRTVRTFVETVDYADGTAWRAAPPFEALIDQPATARRAQVAAHADGGLDWTAPAGGPIEITHAHFFLVLRLGKQLECISFKNVSGKTVSAFQVHFAFHAVDGSVPEENTQTRTGTFGPGVENFGGADDSPIRPLSNCWSYKMPPDEPASVRITIPSVTFADGTTAAGSS